MNDFTPSSILPLKLLSGQRFFSAALCLPCSLLIASGTAHATDKQNGSTSPSVAGQTTPGGKPPTAAASAEASRCIKKGLAEIQTEQFDMALADLNRGLQLDHRLGTVDVIDARRKAYSAKGLWKEAISDSSTAIKLKPANGWLYNVRGRLYYELKQYNLAIPDFLRTTELLPNFLWGHIALGNCYDATGKFDKSVASYTRAIQLAPDAAKAYHFRANAYEKLGKKALALKDRQLASSLSNGWEADLFPPDSGQSKK